MKTLQRFCYLAGLGALVASAHVFSFTGQEQVEIHAPYLGTSPDVAEAMLRLARTSENDVVYDLGCGDGRIVIMAAKQFGARGVGIDINPDRIEEARANAQRAGVADRLRFEVGDVHDINIDQATVVTLYLLPDINLRLRPKLQTELKPGARIVSHSFDMGDWTPSSKKHVNGATIYLWKLRKKWWLPFALAYSLAPRDFTQTAG